VQPSNAPLTSAKLIIIDGVGPRAGGFAKGPVCCLSDALIAPSDAETAAYSTLFGPAAIAAMLPKKVEVPE
jgi:hypothetical protein